MNDGSLPTRPPASLPLAMSPCAPAASAARASSTDVTSASTVRSCHRAMHAGSPTTTTRARSGRALTSTPSGMRTPKRGSLRDSSSSACGPGLRVATEVDDAERSRSRQRHHEPGVRTLERRNSYDGLDVVHLQARLTPPDGLNPYHAAGTGGMRHHG